MAAYRLHRGIDVRDVADAHLAVLVAPGAAYQCCIASAATPLLREDLAALWHCPADVLGKRCRALLSDSKQRHWPLTRRIDRVYDAAAEWRQWRWRIRFGYVEVLAQADRRSVEVLPFQQDFADRTRERDVRGRQ